MVKTAWKVIAPADKGRFHSDDVLVYSPASVNPKYPARCTMKTVGLVGMHIAHKSHSSPQWIWPTFEQVDNIQTDPVANPDVNPSYFNPNCATCLVNEPQLIREMNEEGG